MKNILLLIVLSWATYSLAKTPVVKETVTEADAYKVEKPVAEQSAQRSVAGDKIKKKKKFGDEASKEEVSVPADPDSEVRFWKYSEE